LKFDISLRFVVGVFYQANRHNHGARYPMAALRKGIGKILLSG